MTQDNHGRPKKYWDPRKNCYVSEMPYDTFSLPPKNHPDYHSHETIIRPPFDNLDGCAKKYL